MIKWFLNGLVYSEEELCKRRARDFCLNVWLQLYLLDMFRERDRLFWRVCYGGHWIRDLPFTSLFADLIARRIDTRMCQGGAENTSSKGQNYSENKGKWSKAFMEMYVIISYLYTLYQVCKTYELLPSFWICVCHLCISWFLIFFHQFYSSSLFLCFHFPRRKGHMSFGGTSISFG